MLLNFYVGSKKGDFSRFFSSFEMSTWKIRKRGERKNCPEMASASKERISETDKVANFGLALLPAESADLGSQGSLGWLGSQDSSGRQIKYF